MNRDRRRRTPRRPNFAACAALVLWLLPVIVVAHEVKGLGALKLTIGWGDEPAFSGLRNSVDVVITDTAGKPISDPAGTLSVEVAFGDQRVTMPLRPASEFPGLHRAWIVPTRAGTYTFRITGKMKGQAIDYTSTCSEKTFHCVTDVSEVQFPAKDPPTGQLAEGVSRVLPRADRALEAAGRARTLSLTAIGLAACALGAAVSMALRKASKA